MSAGWLRSIAFWFQDAGAAISSAVKCLSMVSFWIKAAPPGASRYAVLTGAMKLAWHQFTNEVHGSYGRRRGIKPALYVSHRLLYSTTPETPQLYLAVRTSLKPSLPERYKAVWDDEKLSPYTTRIVAFIDILGWREIVANSLKEPGRASTILESLLRSVFEGLKIQGGFKSWDYQAAAFSDSIIISVNGEAGSIGVILHVVEHMTNAALLNGWLLRGGITYGPMFHSGPIAFGPALTEAYELESRLAIYPRIIVDDELAMQINGALIAQFSSESECWTLENFRQDFDGVWYFDYFRGIALLSRNRATPVRGLIPEHHEFRFSAISKIAANAISQFANNPYILKKYVWVVLSYNVAAVERESQTIAIEGIDSGIVQEFREAGLWPIDYGENAGTPAPRAELT
jgi:hypothetical protein